MSRDGESWVWPESIRRAIEDMPIIRRPAGSPTIKDVMMTGSEPPAWPTESTSNLTGGALDDIGEIELTAHARGETKIEVLAHAACDALRELDDAISEVWQR